jgi:signal transduction histidine kinase
MTRRRQPLILTIEDESSIRDSFCSYLEDFGYAVIEAVDGVSGLDAFQTHAPDLVLLDLRMPGMGGIDVLCRIREVAPDTPVIIISGTGRIEDVVEALRRGAQDYLLKPVEDLSILMHAVEQALERARLIRETRRHHQQLESKVAERTQDLATANRQLRKSEAKYRLLFESMRHGFALCRPEHHDSPPGRCRLVEVNPAFASMMGADTSVLLTHTLGDLFPGIDFSAAERQQACRDGYHHLYHDRSRDCYFDMLVYRRSNQDVVLMLADVTERQRLKIQLQQAQKMEAIGTLAGGISHDFNNILGALMGYGELALMDLETDHPARPKVEQMLGSCHRAKDLVGRILAFSRQSPKGEAAKTRVDQVVEEVFQLLRAALPTTIEMRQQIHCSRATVAADATQIHQILMNLCTNAHHAMRDAGGVLTVSVDCLDFAENAAGGWPSMPAGAYVCLTIEDTGEGMDTETLQRAFDPYFTTKPKGEGTGLGLAVVHGLVKGWHGDIRVDSAPGCGTTFRIVIPRISDAPKNVPTASLETATGSGRVLMVDDEEALVLVGKEMLEHAGYTVTIRTCPREALAEFESDPDRFDVVLTDMTMPAFTGDQLTRAIHRIRPDIPVILCSGYSNAMEAAMASGEGFAAVLMKPLMMDALLNAVATVLEPL